MVQIQHPHTDRVTVHKTSNSR